MHGFHCPHALFDCNLWFPFLWTVNKHCEDVNNVYSHIYVCILTENNNVKCIIIHSSEYMNGFLLHFVFYLFQRLLVIDKGFCCKFVYHQVI